MMITLSVTAASWADWNYVLHYLTKYTQILIFFYQIVGPMAWKVKARHYMWPKTQRDAMLTVFNAIEGYTTNSATDYLWGSKTDYITLLLTTSNVCTPQEIDGWHGTILDADDFTSWCTEEAHFEESLDQIHHDNKRVIIFGKIIMMS